MGTLIYPANDISANKLAKSAEVIAMFEAVKAVLNGNVENVNIKAAAGIEQSKVATLVADMAARLLKAGDQMTGRLRLKLPAGDEFALVVTGTDLLIEENTGTDGAPVWVSRIEIPVGAVFGTPSELTTVLASAEGTSKTLSRSDHVHGFKTATASATGTINTDVTMNDFSFFPNLTDNGGTRWDFKSIDTADPGDTISRIRIQNGGGTWVLRWRYVTASRPPELFLLTDKATGEPVGLWQAELPHPLETPIAGDDTESLQIIGDLPASHRDMDIGGLLKAFRDGDLWCERCDLQDVTAERDKGVVIVDDLRVRRVVAL